MADFVMKNLAKHFPSVRSGFSMKKGAQALSKGDGISAVDYFKTAVEAKTLVLKSPNNPTVAQAMIQLASAQRMIGENDNATKTLVEALDILQEKSPSDPDLHLHMNNLGVLLRDTKQVDTPRLILSSFVLIPFLIFASYAESSGIFSEAMRMFHERRDSVDKQDYNDMLINVAKTQLLYGKDLYSKNLECLQELLKSKKILKEIIAERREEAIEDEDYHAQYHGMMSQPGDETLGIALRYLAETYVNLFSASSKTTSFSTAAGIEKHGEDDDETSEGRKILSGLELLDEALYAMTEAIEIKKSLEHDENKEAELIVLNHFHKEIIDLRNSFHDKQRRNEGVEGGVFVK